MKKIKKYTSFEGLKSDEERVIHNQESLKKHNEFEKAMKAFYFIKKGKEKNDLPK